jgi:hypothetical protein
MDSKTAERLLDGAGLKVTSRTRTNDNFADRIRAQFPTGYVRKLDDLVTRRWPYLSAEARHKLASIMQLCDVNRWNLNVWDIGADVGSVWEWHCTIPIISVIEALAREYAKIEGWVTGEVRFLNAINVLYDKQVISEPLCSEMHGLRKYRNQIHLDVGTGLGTGLTYNDAVRTLQSLEGALLWDWKQFVKPVVEFGRIRVEDGGFGTGILINCSFTLRNLVDERCRAVAFFYFESGEQLRDFNDQFNTADGHAAGSQDFIPSHHDTAFTDLCISMPYEELHLESGMYDLKCYVGLFSDDMNCYFAISPWQHLQITLP